MKSVVCKSCGSNDLYKEDGYMVCRYCGTKSLITEDDRPAKESDITLNEDVANLLRKIEENPDRARKYAERILEMDPNNARAKKILGIGEQSGSGGGCYVATAVYGSYDCPQVWTLRRYRDDMLSRTWYGRAFIRAYYATSPTLVKWFGDSPWFTNLWKPRLDRMVRQLNEMGVSNKPYSDR